MSDKKMKLLTELELFLMKILWSKGEATVHQLMEDIPADRMMAYTTVSTMMRILEEKGIVMSQKVGRGHSYLPLIQKESYAEMGLKNLVDKVFDGNKLTLAKQLLDPQFLSNEELQVIKKMIDAVEQSREL